jgi:hypothetical protein
MFAVTPVDRYKGRKAGFVSAIHNVHIAISFKWVGAVFPRKAYRRVLVVRTASENLVRETKQLPLLETLLENIECWPVVLVAAGGLLTDIYASFADAGKRG